MNRIDAYVGGIVDRLPITAIEKEDFRQELIEHLEAHIVELMSEGWGEQEAVTHAIKSFGDKEQLHKEMQKALFPYLKFVRWIWSAFLLTGSLVFIGYTVMEFFFPEYDNGVYFELGSFVTMLMLTGFICGMIEFFYELTLSEYKLRLLYNPWLIFVVPAIIYGAILTYTINRNFEQFYLSKSDVITIADMYIIPVSVFIYIFVRQIFTWLFIPMKKASMW
ncbi:permease prefix domain 1-containing protein [Pseudalkalibacillus sp. R45]|uniref:permease prefix domain 1-containing protein n=1 Tax=Pseudalkalibacillus sp. R45 TaxID=3457433 RepID=UPI003FCD9904